MTMIQNQVKLGIKLLKNLMNLDALSLNDDVKTQELLNQFLENLSELLNPKK